MKAVAADLLLTLDPLAPTPLYLQLYEELRARILTRSVLAPATKLPSTRALAAALALSRNTVVAAFEQLLAEGYLEGRLGSGTYVARQLPETYLTPGTSPQPPARQTHSELSTRGRQLCQVRFTTSPDPHRLFGETKPVPFAIHLPALDHFPYAAWGKLLRRVWDQARPELFDSPDPAGYRPLREAIAQYARAARAVNCAWTDVVVLPSAKTAFQLAASLLLDPGEPVLAENPGYLNFIAAFHQAANPLVPVPVDQEGFDVAAGERLSPAARLACVTPSHQHPVGVTMSLPRRLAHLDWSSPAFEQAVLAEFMREGHFARHVRRMRSLYRQRREAIRAAAARHLAGLIEFPECHTGLDLVGWLPAGVDDLALAREAATAGVTVTPISPYYLRTKARPGLLLGFAAFDERQIDAGMQRLAPIVTRAIQQRSSR